MAETVSDLLVRITPEGIDQTSDELDQARDSFEETADTAGDSTAMLEEFADRWQGALQAITVGLIASAALLLSRVPVIGESMSALNAIVDAFALRLDDVLRPALGGANEELFRFANTVAMAEGPLGLLFDAMSVIIGIGGPLIVAIAAIGSQLGKWASITKGIIAILQTLGGWISSVISALAGFVAGSLAAAAALGALIGVAAVAVLEITGVLDVIQSLGAAMSGPALDAALALANVLTFGVVGALAVLGAAIVGFVRGTLEGGLSEGFNRAAENARQAADTMVQALTDTLDRLLDVLADISSEFFEAGKSFITELVNGMKDKAGDLGEAAKDLAGKAADKFPSSPAKEGPLSDLDKAGPGLVDTIADGMESSAPRLDRASGQVATAADPRGGQGGGGGGSSAVNRQLQQLVQAMQRTRQETTLELDGQTVARQLEPLLGEGARLSGATQVRR